jgi:hypothetical protein
LFIFIQDQPKRQPIDFFKHLLILEQQVDFDVFKSLNQTDIYEILSDYPVGIKKKVHQSYEVWQKAYISEDIPIVSTITSYSVPTSNAPQIAQQSSKDGVR